MEIFQLFGIATIFGALISSLVNHLLQNQRESDSRIFEARREAYADVLKALNYAYLKDGEQIKKMTNQEFSVHIKINLGECFSRAKVLACKKLSDKLRELYDVETAIFSANFVKLDHTLDEKRAILVREVEELMKVDLKINKTN